ncbi:hypothetical protein J1N35_011566 [Gossypium stocksii]|uniref:DUF4283 domain-containing protein n=1 Tax=Gossypium stocksii TaxID=47602 RepID=A0A9D3W3Q5_9ROSI|nr:hypothetical protein J1N35_011566 [Gossypium stocksii]
MIVEPSSTPSKSWKDMLVGKDSPGVNDSNGGHLLVDNFFHSEQDIKKSVVDGIPSIDFSERVYKLLENEMSTSVVLKMLGRNLGITTLHNRLYGIWKPSMPFQLMDIEKGYFLTKFQSPADYDMVLSQGLGFFLVII